MLMKKDHDKTENENQQQMKQTENGNQLKMKQGEMKLSKFGIGFELTGFVAFLSWTGMCLYSLLGVVSVLLGALGMEPYFLMASGSDYRNYELVSVMMQGFGCAFLVIAVEYFVMNFFLRKENRENQGCEKDAFCDLRHQHYPQNSGITLHCVLDWYIHDSCQPPVRSLSSLALFSYEFDPDKPESEVQRRKSVVLSPKSDSKVRSSKYDLSGQGCHLKSHGPPHNNISVQ